MGKKFYPWLKPGIWGVVIGAGGIMILGFSQFGWVLPSKAEEMAHTQANTAVAAALAPVCAGKFFAQADSAANLAELQKLGFDYVQRDFIEKGGWAVAIDVNVPNYQLASECAKRILAAKPA